MCGIAGFISVSVRSQDIDKSHFQVLGMAKKIRHRGPDSFGSFCDKESGVALSHRRLAILDISDKGAQPMSSPDGRYTIIFNGEIYNYKHLSKIISKTGHTFQSYSDTEVLLSAIQIWGIEYSLKLLEGMFGFALWDKKKKILTLARDRLGEKPLYYGFHGKTFLFGSEIKALKAHPDWENEINRDSLTSYLYHNYVPSPYSIYKNIYKLMPGNYLQISPENGKNDLLKPISYWSLESVIKETQINPLKLNDKEAIGYIENILKDSVRSTMNSDVPLGAFLSGGIDSSLIVALMQNQSQNKIKTFTIGFFEKEYNEAKEANNIAKYLNTDHHELYVSAKQALDALLKIQNIYDEPFSDSSQIPTYILSKMTQKHVTVALSGDGGDELFGGYERYFLAQKIWNNKSYMPMIVSKLINKLTKKLSLDSLDNVINLFFRIFDRKYLYKNPSEKLKRLSEMLIMTNIEEVYSHMICHWNNSEEVVIGGKMLKTPLVDSTRWLENLDSIHKMMYLDTISYLPDDILVKVDRAAMSVSLETRLPFLNHKVIQAAWSLSIEQKIKNGKGKWILKEILKKYLPQRQFEEPKKGFAVPIDSWLRNELRDWAESLLDQTRLKNQGFFSEALIRKKWQEHLSGKYDWHHHLWDILMFQSWLESNSD